MATSFLRLGDSPDSPHQLPLLFVIATTDWQIQLPYPIYKLRVKGYYGQPVDYCLHMTKFNSRFNSQTGNFEITANFIGYTYAMLSDMLLGYLRAIPYTVLGIEKYKKLKDEDNTILTLDELYKQISLINQNVDKILSNSDLLSCPILGYTILFKLIDLQCSIKA